MTIPPPVLTILGSDVTTTPSSFTAEQKQNILNTFVEKYKVSEQEAIDNINKGLKENRQSTIEQLKKCY